MSTPHPDATTRLLPDETPAELGAWWRAWIADVAQHWLVALPAAAESEHAVREMPAWRARARALTDACDRPSRWLKLWRECRTGPQKQRDLLMAWLNTVATAIPTTGRRGGSVEVMVAGAATMLATMPSYRPASQEEALAKWIQAFEAPGRAGRARPSPASAHDVEPRMTWRDATPADQAGIVAQAMARRDVTLWRTVLTAFPVETLGLDTHWAALLAEELAVNVAPMPTRFTDERIARWWPRMANTGLLKRALANRSDWPVDGIGVVLAKMRDPQWLQITPLALVGGAVEAPTDLLATFLREGGAPQAIDLHHVIRLGREPDQSAPVAPALAEALRERVETRLATARSWYDVAPAIDTEVLLALFDQPTVVSQLRRDTCRWLLTHAPQEVKVRLVGVLAGTPERTAERERSQEGTVTR